MGVDEIHQENLQEIAALLRAVGEHDTAGALMLLDSFPPEHLKEMIATFLGIIGNELRFHCQAAGLDYTEALSALPDFWASRGTA